MQITFICSNNFAGSTFLDVMLGNGKKCFACGEVYNLFRERKRKPLPCICGNPNCNLWFEIQKRGRRDFYHYLYDLGYNRISDSSKRLSWFVGQDEILANQKFNIKKILIYKHPLNWLYSIYKRRFNRPRPPNVELWINYNSRFIRLFGSKYIVCYEDLAQNPKGILRKICKKLDYTYFRGKERFWENTSHHIRGALSIELQFTEKGSPRFKHVIKKLTKHRKGDLHSLKKYRTIYYVDEWKKKLPKKYHAISNEAWNLYNYLEKRKIH